MKFELNKKYKLSTIQDGEEIVFYGTILYMKYDDVVLFCSESKDDNVTEAFTNKSEDTYYYCPEYELLSDKDKGIWDEQINLFTSDKDTLISCTGFVFTVTEI